MGCLLPVGRPEQFLYIQNHDVDKMPGYNAVQGGPATEIMKHEKDQDLAIARSYELSYGKRPEEELYDCTQDPFQMILANLPEHAEAKKQLRTQLERYLVSTKDPRALGQSEIFLKYPIWYRRGKKAGESIFLVRNRDGELSLETRLERSQ